MKNAIGLSLLALALSLSIGCTQSKAVDALPAAEKAAASGNNPAASYDPSALRMPEASGKVVKEKNGAYMDASHTDQGYVMIRCDAGGTVRKAGVSADDATYYYTLPQDGSYAVCPLQMGNGAYTVQVYERIAGTQYSPLCKWTLEVALAEDTLPYLYPNQYVNYDALDEAVRLSFAAAAGTKATRDTVKKLYDYVAAEIDYDYDKAASVQSGYLPSPDRTLAEKKGICFDYAALLAAMLRVQNVPARLQMGELSPDNIYHAWNLVKIDDAWYLMDATLDGQGYSDENYSAAKNY